jgi:hypothetical protein
MGNSVQFCAKNGGSQRIFASQLHGIIRPMLVLKRSVNFRNSFTSPISSVRCLAFRNPGITPFKWEARARGMIWGSILPILTCWPKSLKRESVEAGNLYRFRYDGQNKNCFCSLFKEMKLCAIFCWKKCEKRLQVL